MKSYFSLAERMLDIQGLDHSDSYSAPQYLSFVFHDHASFPNT